MHISPTKPWPLFTNICVTYHFHSVGTLSDTYLFYCAGGRSLEESVPPERPYSVCVFFSFPCTKTSLPFKILPWQREILRKRMSHFYSMLICVICSLITCEIKLHGMKCYSQQVLDVRTLHL